MIGFQHSIVNEIHQGARVLDLGCGNGEFMELLIQTKQVIAYGIDIDPDNILTCLNKGLNVIEHDINSGLDLFSPNTFDVVIFSETLQEIKDPVSTLDAILRIATTCIISFPNFAFLPNRIQGLLGRTPQSASLPHTWFESPNIRFLSIYDFKQFCHRHAIELVKPLPLFNAAWLNAIIPHCLDNLAAPRGRFIIQRQA